MTTLVLQTSGMGARTRIDVSESYEQVKEELNSAGELGRSFVELHLPDGKTRLFHADVIDWVEP